MTDRLRISGDAVIEEDENTGDISINANDVTAAEDVVLGPGSDIENIKLGYSPAGNGRLYIVNDGNLMWFDTTTVHVEGGIDVDIGGNEVYDVGKLSYTPTDVRTISSPGEGMTAYHDGSGTNTEGPAHYNGTDWISTVDGTTIS